MSDLQMPRIKELKMFKVFVSMATKLSKRHRFLQNYCNFNANYLTSAKRNMNNVCTFLKGSYLLNKCEKEK